VSETKHLRELVEDTGSWEKLHRQASAELDALLAENERLRKQRDEAIEALEHIDEFGSIFQGVVCVRICKISRAALERMKIGGLK
jgi:hypothetical protein